MFVLTSTERKFIPTSQKDIENPLTFLIKPPTRKTVLDIQEKLVSSLDDEGELNPKDIPLSELMEVYFSNCVVGWENVNDSKGNAVIFSTETFATFNDAVILNELYTEIKELAEGSPLV